MDVVTSYVLDNGFSQKAREFRQEFFTKTDFAKECMNLVSMDDMKRIQGDITNDMKRIKDKAIEMQGTERE